MTQKHLSMDTAQALLQSMSRVIASVCVPKGEWLEFDRNLHGYQVSSLQFELEGNARLRVWSTNIGREDEEQFALEATFLDKPTVEADKDWEVASPLRTLLKGRQLKQYEEILVEDHLPADGPIHAGVRLRFARGHVDLLTTS